MGAELNAYVSRGILVCPCVGGREALNRSRHRVITVFGREAKAPGHWWQGILQWGELGSG